MRIPKDQLETYFSYGVDVVNRCIFLTGDIDEESVSNVVKGLYLMESQDSQHSPIELRISSYGGEDYEMMCLHDVTRTLKSPIHTMGMGKVMSAAVLLVACGQRGERWAGAYTSFMIHSPSWRPIYKKLEDHVVEVKEVGRICDQWYTLMEKYTNKDAAFWRKLCAKREDIYFDAAQAQEWGIIDHIWSEKDEDTQ